ncbi:unnamed protein product [Caenorhabditis brenneri]
MVSNCTSENKNKIPKVSPTPINQRGKAMKKGEKAPNGQILLLKLIHETIESGQHSGTIIWINEEKTAFHFLDKDAFTILYAAHFRKLEEKWDNIARQLRFNRANGFISKLSDSAYVFNHALDDIVGGRVVPIRSSPVPPKSPKSTGNNAKAMKKGELKVGVVKPKRREATQEEMEAIYKELEAKLVPFEEFLSANQLKELDFVKQIQIYSQHLVLTKNIPLTQNLIQ